MEFDSAHALIAKAVKSGRPAHGYLVVGGVRGMAHELALAVLRDLFPGFLYRLSSQFLSRVFRSF